MDKKDYFSDDCIVKDVLFNALKDLLTCPLCNKIYNEPLMCSNCQNVYCEECLKNYPKSNACPNNCINFKFVKSINKNELLSKIKYKCKNCSKEVNRNDIKSHLESNCEKTIEKTKTLSEIYQTKKRITKLSPKEMMDVNKSKIKHFTSKSNKISFFINNSYNPRRYWGRKN